MISYGYKNLAALQLVSVSQDKRSNVDLLDYAAVLGEKALALLPMDTSIRRLLGQIYLQSHQLRKASSVPGVNEVGCPDVITCYIQGETLRAYGDDGGAITLWRTIANIDQYFAFQGDIAFEKGDKSEALRLYNLSWRIKDTPTPKKTTMFLNLCREHRNAREIAIAIYWCEQAVRSRNDYWTTVELGRTYFEAKQYKSAESTLREAILLAPERGSGYYWLGLTLQRLGFIQEGLEELYKSVHLDPKNPWARIDLASTLALMGEYRKAACEYIKAQELANQSNQTELLRKIQERIAVLPLNADDLRRCGD